MAPEFIITDPVCDIIVALVALYLRIMNSAGLLLVPYQIPPRIKKQDFVICRPLTMRA